MGEPKIGDYVYCEEGDGVNHDDKVLIFISNNIGKVYKYVYDYYLIKYNINFKEEGIKKEEFQFIGDPKGCRKMYRKEIKYWSKSKEELELKIATQKYNL